MFGLLKNLTKAAVGIAVTPIDVAADIVTLGGTLTDKDKPYTAARCEQVMDNLEKAIDPEED